MDEIAALAGGWFAGCLTKIIEAGNVQYSKKRNTSVYNSNHELEANEKMAGATRRKQSALPMHGTTELGKGLEAAIKRQLGLK